MYNIGDHIIYGKTGICAVKDIGYQEIPGSSARRLYYTLKPIYAAGVIYTPVDNTSVFMRHAVNHDEAMTLIQQIPAIENTIDDTSDITGKELPEYYKSLMASHDCTDLIKLIITVYAKKQQAEQDKKKIGQTDQNFMRNAEELLYGELSVALGIDKENVPSFIEQTIA
ncbi:MAG TPA: CarD family transcriptional regulator [Clostridia bacterium]|nr:CarD family transcriptional regulator [Clostridia bacterium]